MSEESAHRPLVFSVVETTRKRTTTKISEKEYQRDLVAGIAERYPKPGRYKIKRGGFLKRHLSNLGEVGIFGPKVTRVSLGDK